MAVHYNVYRSTHARCIILVLVLVTRTAGQLHYWIKLLQTSWHMNEQSRGRPSLDSKSKSRSESVLAGAITRAGWPPTMPSLTPAMSAAGLCPSRLASGRLSQVRVIPA